ncbi:hypothetical protein BsWGS_05387 [Bradybaena similaris]
MNSLRRWLYRPKRTDSSLLAQFYFADEDLNQVAAELDSFEGRKDPERCTTLVNQLRACQARVLNVVSQIMDEQVKDFRASRDFRVKFPDDVIQENLAGQLWFGAECLAAGSSIMNREVESACMRPLARALTKNLDSLRNVLRDQCLRNVHEYTDPIKESLIIFDKLFAEFELSYVSAMVPVKTAHEYDLVQEITVLFSETVQRALKVGLLTRDMIDEYDPALMFTIPRLAIVSGVHIFKDGPLNPDNDPWNLSEMFRPFQTLLLKIRELLGILTDEELNTLERALCSQEEPSFLLSLEEKKKQNAKLEKQKSREERSLTGATSRTEKDKDESDDGSMENELTALEIAERLEALALNFETSRNAKLAQSNEHSDHDIHNQSSESMSSSSCSFYSETEVEERDFMHVERELGSDQSGQTQLQQFTQQPHHETTIDSRTMTHSIPVEEHHHALMPEFTVPSCDAIDAIRSSISGTEHSPSSDPTTQENSQIDKSSEAAAVGRAHFAMNKGDSSDSGLHSEVLSNSDSTFTISSSDSNQHVAISDVPGASESDTNHGECTNSQSGFSVVDHTQQMNEDDAHNKSKESLETVVSVSEVENHNLDSCLIMTTGAGGDSARARSSDVGNVTFPSFQPDQKVHAGDIAAKYSDSISRHPNGITLNVDVHSAVSDLCCENSLRLNTESTTSRAFPQTSGNSIEIIMQASDTESTSASQTLMNTDQCASYNCRVNGSESGEVVQWPQGLTNSSHETRERSFSEHSKISHNSKDHICDRGEQSAMFNADCAGETTKERGHSSDVSNLVPCANSDVFSTHSPVPTAVIEDRENNNNHIKKCAILTQNSDVHSDSKQETVSASATRQTNNCVSVLISQEQCATESSSEQGSVVSPQPPSASITTTESTTTSTADSTHVLKASIDVAQESRKLTPSPPPSHNTISTHVLTTNTSSSSVPNVSTPKGHYGGIKGSSRTRSLKKSSKMRQHQQDTSSSHNQRPGLPIQAKVLIESQLLDSECNHSSETSSYTSDCGDQEEIDLAVKAAENATRQQVRARFESSSDMIHRLFVCISGVADQLQTNFAGDLRNILRAVFDMNCSELVDIGTDDKCKDTTPLVAAYRAVSQASRSRRARSSANQRQEPPSWLPDEQTSDCMSCQVPFTFLRRRHHCRNCGKIFCSRCSSNFVPLPHFGHEMAVRVCNRCFMFQVTPFTARQATQ